LHGSKPCGREPIPCRVSETASQAPRGAQPPACPQRATQTDEDRRQDIPGDRDDARATRRCGDSDAVDWRSSSTSLPVGGSWTPWRGVKKVCRARVKQVAGGERSFAAIVSVGGTKSPAEG